MNHPTIPNDQTIVKMVATINSCQTLSQIMTASRMLDAYERLYGFDAPLRGFLLNAEFHIVRYRAKRIQLC